MKTSPIKKLNLAVTVFFVSSFAFGAAVHHVVETHTRVEEKQVSTKVESHVSNPDITKTTTTKVTHVTVSNSPMIPSTNAAKASVSKFFTTLNKTTLSGHQVIELTMQQHIKGQQAAMLAALMVQTNNALSANSKLSIKNISYTKDELMKKFADKNSKFYIAYENALNKINQVKTLPANRELYGPNEISAKTKIIQGSEGDCYFLSAINGLLHTPNGASQIKSMMAKVPGQANTFTVKFPGDSEPLTIHLTDAEIGMYSHVEKGGKWLAILSVAEAMNLRKKNIDPQAMMNGGMPQQTLGMFTGKKYISETLPTGTLTPTDQQNVIEKIRNAEKNGLPITISTTDHVLAILGCQKCTVQKNSTGQVTSVTGTVLIKNPWGSNDIWYNPKLGTWSKNKTGVPEPRYYMSHNGELQVPLSELNQGFGYIVYHPEDASKLKPLTPSSA